MVYINGKGELVDRPPFSWTSPFSILMAIANFVILFFTTMFRPTSDGPKTAQRSKINGLHNRPAPPAPPMGGGGG